MTDKEVKIDGWAVSRSVSCRNDSRKSMKLFRTGSQHIFGGKKTRTSRRINSIDRWILKSEHVKKYL